MTDNHEIDKLSPGDLVKIHNKSQCDRCNFCKVYYSSTEMIVWNTNNHHVDDYYNAYFLFSELYPHGFGLNNNSSFLDSTGKYKACLLLSNNALYKDRFYKCTPLCLLLIDSNTFFVQKCDVLPLHDKE